MPLVSVRFRRNAALGVSAVLLLLLGLWVVVPPESSVAGASAAEPEASFGSIEPDRLGSLTVHKHEWQPGEPVVASIDGSVPIPSAPVPGVQFTVWRMTDVSLTQPSGWASLPATPPAEVCAGQVPAWGSHTFGPGQLTVTDAQGVAAFGVGEGEGLPVGAYLVCETGVSGPSNRAVIDRAAPFVATLPAVDPVSGGWRYAVHAYPKNAVSTITKRVASQEQLGLGAMSRFPVTVDVPVLGPDTSFRFFAVRDAMPGFSEAGVQSVRVGEQTVDEDLYRVTVGQGNAVMLSFTAQGLSWLASGDRPGARVTVVFQGRLTSVGSGVATNQAEVLIDTLPGPTPPDLPEPEGPGVPSNGVETAWGELMLKKVDAQEPSTGLSGAEFQVYAAATPYPQDGVCGDVPTGDPIEVGAGAQRTSVFRSDASGRVRIAGLFVADAVVTEERPSSRCYVVKEIRAPAGFQIPAAAYTGVKVRTGPMTEAVVTIPNSRLLVAGLPLTGATGRVLLLLGGAGLLLVGVGAWLVSRRRGFHRDR